MGGGDTAGPRGQQPPPSLGAECPGLRRRRGRAGRGAGLEELGGGHRRSAEVSGQDAGKGRLIPSLRQSLRPPGALTGLSINPAAPAQDKPEATASRLPPQGPHASAGPRPPPRPPCAPGSVGRGKHIAASVPRLGPHPRSMWERGPSTPGGLRQPLGLQPCPGQVGFLLCKPQRPLRQAGQSQPHFTG